MKDIRFPNFSKVQASKMKELVHVGVVTTVKQAEVILPEHEEKLWETGAFCDNSAELFKCQQKCAGKSTLLWHRIKHYGPPKMSL